MERIRKETIEEYFYNTPLRNEHGVIIPAPKEAVDKYLELKDSWMLTHPKLPLEIPSVILHPVQKESRVGYVVETQIIYKPV